MVRFVTFEGSDGTGKTTQIRALESYLSCRGKACLVTREPGGTELGAMLRRVLLQAGGAPIAPSSELFLYLADRAQHVSEVIRPALAAGKIVLCDRFTDSTLAYQGYGRGLDLGLLRQFNSVADDGTRPDLTLLLDCPIAVGLGRTASRQAQSDSDAAKEDRFEREKMEFHEKVRAGFLDLARQEPGRFRVIDAAQPAAQVSLAIGNIIDEALR
ncbi:MAG: dTMP kinase [Candidatus Binatia bacterium]